jgi:hypothetical protein
MAEGGIITRFVEQFRARVGMCSFIQCVWWNSSDGILLSSEEGRYERKGRGESHRLKPEYLDAHPAYPYAHNMCAHGAWCSIDFTLVSSENREPNVRGM